MVTVADDCAGDAPPRKPKPFLKRGEGVNKRLSAYKLRDEAAALRKQRASDSSSRPWSVDAGDREPDSSHKADVQQHTRRTWQPQQQAGVQPVQQQRAQSRHMEPEQASPRHAAPAGAHALSSSKATAQMVEQSSWTTGPDVEDLELEEFRALEREILGDVATSASHTSTQWQQAQQHPHSQRQQPHLQQQHSQQQQLSRQQLEEEEAERQYAEYADQLQQQQQQQDTDLQEPLQQQGMYRRHAVSASGAADDAGGPLQGNTLHDMGFQDDTEWVDTEFSFADLSLEAQQDQTRAAGQHRAQQQRQQQQELQQRQQAGMLQQRDLPSSAAAADDFQGPLAQQPYIRSVFKQQQQQQQQQQSSRPVSSHNRVGTAASKRPQRGSKSPPGAAAAADDPDQAMVTVTVPAAAVARLEQLDAAQAALQQERVGLRKMRQELEKAAQQLELQRAAWERDRAAQLTNFEAWKAEETKQLANRRRVLDQQQKALYKMPTKKDKSALEALEAALEREKADGRAAAARHKLTVERLRCQAKQLQDRNNELREEVRWHQAQQLSSTAFAAKDSKAHKRPTVSAHTQTEPFMTQPLRASQGLQQEADAWTAAAAAAAPAVDNAGALYAALFGEDDEDDAVFSGSVAGSAQLNGISQQLQQEQQQGRWMSERVSVDADGLYARASSSNGRAAGMQQTRGVVAAATTGSNRLMSSGSSNGASGPEGWGLGVGPLVSEQQAAAVAAADEFSFLQTSGTQQGGSGYQADHRNSRSGSAADGGWLVPAGADAAGAAHNSDVSSSSTGKQRQAPALTREVLKEYNYPDGKVEQLYDDGSREVHYVNGSSQVHRVDGSMLVYFGNNDIKRQWPDGRVDYFYAEVSVWQCTHPDGLEVFHYPTGQVEGHFPDGRKEVIFADGAARIVTQDGREHDVTRAMLSVAVLEGPPDLDNL